MSSPAKQAPAKASTPPVKAAKTKIDFSQLQEVEGGTIRHSTTDQLEGTPIRAQLAKSWAAKSDKGFGSTFTVGPVDKSVVEQLRNMYRRAAAEANHGVAFTYNEANGALTVRAQNKKAFDMSPEAVADRARRRAIAKAAKDAAKATK